MTKIERIVLSHIPGPKGKRARWGTIYSSLWWKGWIDIEPAWLALKSLRKAGLVDASDHFGATGGQRFFYRQTEAGAQALLAEEENDTVCSVTRFDGRNVSRSIGGGPFEIIGVQFPAGPHV